MLFVDEQLRITDDVDEQDMCDLESKIGGRFGHSPMGLYTQERPTLNVQPRTENARGEN